MDNNISNDPDFRVNDPNQFGRGVPQRIPHSRRPRVVIRYPEGV